MNPNELKKMLAALHNGDISVDQAFERLAHEADEGCPVSNLLRPGLEIEIEAQLI